jgi:hypothetical protein
MANKPDWWPKSPDIINIDSGLTPHECYRIGWKNASDEISQALSAFEKESCPVVVKFPEEKVQEVIDALKNQPAGNIEARTPSNSEYIKELERQLKIVSPSILENIQGKFNV